MIPMLASGWRDLSQLAMLLVCVAPSIKLGLPTHTVYKVCEHWAATDSVPIKWRVVMTCKLTTNAENPTSRHCAPPMQEKLSGYHYAACTAGSQAVFAGPMMPDERKGADRPLSEVIRQRELSAHRSSYASRLSRSL